jgi:hypothetical protein
MAPKKKPAEVKAEQQIPFAKKAKVTGQAAKGSEAQSEDAAEEIGAGHISQMLSWLKYRADPEKNKKGEQLVEAQRALEAHCIDMLVVDFANIHTPGVLFFFGQGCQAAVCEEVLSDQEGWQTRFVIFFNLDLCKLNCEGFQLQHS